MHFSLFSYQKYSSWKWSHPVNESNENAQNVEIILYDVDIVEMCENNAFVSHLKRAPSLLYKKIPDILIPTFLILCEKYRNKQNNCVDFIALYFCLINRTRFFFYKYNIYIYKYKAITVLDEHENWLKKISKGTEKILT